MPGIIEEYDHLMRLSASGIKIHPDAAGLADRIHEWLETPEGTIADHPSWGNNLGPFKHEPPGVNLEVMVELSIFEKMPLDIENLIVLGVSVRYEEIDRFRVVIRHQLGNYENELRL